MPPCLVTLFPSFGGLSHSLSKRLIRSGGPPCLQVLTGQALPCGMWFLMGKAICWGLLCCYLPDTKLQCSEKPKPHALSPSHSRWPRSAHPPRHGYLQTETKPLNGLYGRYCVDISLCATDFTDEEMRSYRLTGVSDVVQFPSSDASQLNKSHIRDILQSWVHPL